MRLTKNKIAKNHAKIREEVKATGSTIIPRTQAQNRKCTATTLEEEQARRASITAEHIQHMQKALSQMNLQLHNVISDITGEIGMKIIRAMYCFLCCAM